MVSATQTLSPPAGRCCQPQTQPQLAAGFGGVCLLNKRLSAFLIQDMRQPSVPKGASLKQGFANKYNWHQFPLGKTRTKSSKNRRIRTRFAFLLSGLAICMVGHLDDANIWLNGAEGFVF